MSAWPLLFFSIKFSMGLCLTFNSITVNTVEVISSKQRGSTMSNTKIHDEANSEDERLTLR